MYQLLKCDSAAPVWHELIPETKVGDAVQPAVRGLFAPITRPARRAAQLVSAEVQPTKTEAGDPAAVPSGPSHFVMIATGEAYGAEIIRRTLIELDGVGDADGNPVAVTPDVIEQFIADDRLFEAAYAKHVLPDLIREAEKNGLSPSPDGTGAGAMPEKAIAASAAKGKRGKGAKPVHI